MGDERSFDWDKANVAHIARHKVAPEEAEQALFNDPMELDYDVVKGEERWTSAGHTNKLRVLVIVWTLRGDAVRVVTARDLSKAGRTRYLRHKGFTL